MSEKEPSIQIFVGSILWCVGGIMTVAMAIGVRNYPSNLTYLAGLALGGVLLIGGFYLAITKRKVF
jgi:ABC-type xylose transport system permease subunit